MSEGAPPLPLEDALLAIEDPLIPLEDVDLPPEDPPGPLLRDPGLTPEGAYADLGDPDLTPGYADLGEPGLALKGADLTDRYEELVVKRDYD